MTILLKSLRWYDIHEDKFFVEMRTRVHIQQIIFFFSFLKNKDSYS